MGDPLDKITIKGFKSILALTDFEHFAIDNWEQII